MTQSSLNRCSWSDNDPLMRSYHDAEWGVPEYDSRALWEKLILDGFQAGLSWLIVLKRREGFRRAFEGFDPRIVASYTAQDVERLMNDVAIIRSKAKIEATIGNAKIYLAMQESGEDFSQYLWSFVGGVPMVNSGLEIPVKTKISEDLSADLKKRGFKFVGPVIVYAWMQAVGMVNDHAPDCFLRTV
jgi:DNA-3-methyladenine glycosylase I